MVNCGFCCQSVLIFFSFGLWQQSSELKDQEELYTQAKDYIERGRKCLATELAALVTNSHSFSPRVWDIRVFEFPCGGMPPMWQIKLDCTKDMLYENCMVLIVLDMQFILMPMICNLLVALRLFLSWFFVRSLIEGLSGFKNQFFSCVMICRCWKVMIGHTATWCGCSSSPS
jgi:hypothetical protein